MTTRMTFTYPGGGALQPQQLPVMPRRWGWHVKTLDLCVLMPALDYSKAKCVGRDDLFLADSDQGHKSTQAKAVCAECPIQRQCLAWGLAHEEFGVWGGTTATERAEQRKQLGLRVIEPVTASTYGLNDDVRKQPIPDKCNSGHHLKFRYDAVARRTTVNSPYRTEYTVQCTQCYYEKNESPEAREELRRRAFKAAQSLKERGTRNTGKRNKWGGGC